MEVLDELCLHETENCFAAFIDGKTSLRVRAFSVIVTKIVTKKGFSVQKVNYLRQYLRNHFIIEAR